MKTNTIPPHCQRYGAIIVRPTTRDALTAFSAIQGLEFAPPIIQRSMTFMHDAERPTTTPTILVSLLFEESDEVADVVQRHAEVIAHLPYVMGATAFVQDLHTNLVVQKTQ